MAGLVPAIHVFFCRGDNKGVDARDKPGHDGTAIRFQTKRPRQNRGLWYLGTV